MGMIFGLDIGYSNVKLTFGESEGRPETVVFPIGAAPLKTFNDAVQGVEGGHLDITKVDVDGETYAVGYEPGKIANAPRYISENYTKTKEYKALFYAALLYAETNHIDLLVTGLPVSHYKDEALRKELQEMMQGEHKVGARRTICVDKVSVIPQPGGGFINALNEAIESGDEKKANIMQHGSCLVIDPGYFSNDFVVFEEGSLVQDASNSSLQATSKIFELAAKRIGDSIPHRPGKDLKPHNLEKAIRNGTKVIYFQGQEVNVAEELKGPSKEIGKLALSEVLNNLREHSPDIIVLVGGGADFFEESVKETFSGLEVIKSPDSVAAVSKGYWMWGVSK
ncbi:hypothetical protein [Halomonas casei]|uniref:ParM/StbA family protein n=2 Tax=Oceanospirillales TaxID=135619 RepID=UPI003CF3E165